MSLVSPSRESNKNNENLYILLSKEESNKILDEYSKDTINILKVFHKPINQNIGYNNSRTIIINPIRLEPSNINLKDYLFEAADNHIVQVKNINDNTFVLFVGNEEVKEKKNKPINFNFIII